MQRISTRRHSLSRRPILSDYGAVARPWQPKSATATAFAGIVELCFGGTESECPLLECIVVVHHTLCFLTSVMLRFASNKERI